MRRWRFSRLRRLGYALLPERPGSAHTAASGENRHVREIRAEQIRFLFEQLPSALIATTVVGSLVAYVLWGEIAAVWPVTWLAALRFVTWGRAMLRRAYYRARPPAAAAAPWGRRFLLGVLLSGVVWGAAGMFPLPPSALIQQMFVSFVLAGLAAGAMSTLSSYRGAYAAFLLPAILPFACGCCSRRAKYSAR